jgi:endonuclease G
MVPNASVLMQYGQLAQLETFLMSNICPQKPSMNRTIWADLEDEVRKISNIDKNNKEVHDVFVITGPIFGIHPPVRLPSGVAIPTSFFMIIAFQQGFGDTIKAVSVNIPQEPSSSDFEDFLTTIDVIEALTGIEFFAELSNVKQNNLESKKRNFKLVEVN